MTKTSRIIILKDVQQYIKAKNLDNTEAFKYFHGNTINEYAFLLSLLKRHKNDCVVIELYGNQVPSATDKAGRWFNMTGLFEKVRKCAKKEKIRSNTFLELVQRVVITLMLLYIIRLRIHLNILNLMVVKLAEVRTLVLMYIEKNIIINLKEQ